MAESIKDFDAGGETFTSHSVGDQEVAMKDDEEAILDENIEDIETEDTVAMKPIEIVEELDRYIVGQSEAKRAVALALRNRWRRKRITGSLKDEVMPKNMLMIGPTGVGKTEVARRLSKLADAPFIKVEATKYTEMGFHGRDVDSIIRDLVDQALITGRTNKRKKLRKLVEEQVENKILENLVGGERGENRSRTEFKDLLRDGVLDAISIEIEVPIKEPEPPNMGGNQFGFQGTINLINIKGQGKKMEKRKMKIRDAKPLLADIETENMINPEDLKREALIAVQEDGIVFIDEIDKICTTGDRHSADASAEGVQRDLLPLIEGSTIDTKYGNVDTDHILFIASGAFHAAKPSDLLAELQGRLPIRVELQALSEDDLYSILTEPVNNLILQQTELINTEGVELTFTDKAIRMIAHVAHEVNATVENIGARRLHTIIEKIMEEISFDAADMEEGTKIEITQEIVEEKVKEILQSKMDLQNFIL